MKIYCLEENYKDYLYKSLDKISYPFKNNGFNLSFIPMNNNQELYIFRNVFTFKSILEKKLIPGIPEKDYNEKIFNKYNISENFIWDWKNNYESNILFVGKLEKDGKITMNEKISPISLINPTMEYKVPSILRKIPKSMHSMKREDFRLVKIENKIYIIDSFSNMLSEVNIKNNKIILGDSFYKGICEYYFRNTFKKNNVYYKIFEKNWSIYNSFMDKNNILNIYFLDNYTNIGITYVHYTEKSCKQNYLIKYKKDVIPHNDEEIRFSFGSSMIEIEKNIYLGVGHSKVNLKQDKINNKYINLYKKSFELHRELKLKYAKKYKCHKSKMYFYYFFLLNNNENATKKFIISDSFIPVVLCDNYIFSLVFPMSIVKKYNKYWVSCGYGDYTNILLSFTLSEIKNQLIHDVENMDLTKYNFSLI